MKAVVRIFFSVLVIFLNISCDQITKHKVRDEIIENEVINVIGDNFIFTKVHNKGAFLSTGDSLSPSLKLVFLQVVPILILVFMFISMIKDKRKSQINLLGYSFVIGGGIGNIYDRVVDGAVTDFMYLEIGFLRTGIFNMADLSVVIGILLLLINVAIFEYKEKRQKVSEIG